MIKFTLGLATTKESIVLIKKNRPAWQKGKYNFPGGKIEENESPRDCISREFLEETGVVIQPSEWKYLGKMMREDGNIDNFTCRVYFLENEIFNNVKTMETEKIFLVSKEKFLTDKKLQSQMMPNLLWFYHFSQMEDYKKYGVEFTLNFPAKKVSDHEST